MAGSQVEWREWGSEPFEEARNQDRPVLLAIGATWCHWCHVMDQTTYSDPEVVSQINARTIPIRVDADRRPDVDRRFNMGGWPTLVFLTPDRQIITGATYLPPEQFLALLDAAEKAYRSGSPPPAPAEPECLHAADITEPLRTTLNEALALYDSQFGGFGTRPKFPLAALLRWLLVRYLRTADESLKELLTTTLDAMGRGGIRDRKRGGFFRYSTTQDWSIPHFEKMLEDNCELASVYMDASMLLAQPSYADIARSTVDYLMKTLYLEEHQGFAGSQAADEQYYANEGEETEPPPVDRVMIAGWNALAVTMLLKAHALFRDDGFLKTATQVLDSVLQKMFKDDTGIAHYYDGEPHPPYMLKDNALVMLACADAYQIIRQDIYLDRARSLARLMQTEYLDQGKGLLKDTLDTLEQKGLDTRTPLAENSLAAQALIRLSRLDRSRDSQLAVDFAENLLKSLASEATRAGLFAAEYCMAVEELRGTHLEIAVVGNRADPRARELRFGALCALAFPKTVTILDPMADADQITRAGYPSLDKPVAYVCVNRTCTPPVETPEALTGLVRKLNAQSDPR